MNILRLLHKFQVIPAMVPVPWLTGLDIPAQRSKQLPTFKLKIPSKVLAHKLTIQKNIVYITISLVPRPFSEGEEKGPGTHRLRMRPFVPRIWVHRIFP